MDIVEFLEKSANVELYEWQKQHLRILETLPPDISIRVTMDRRKQIYIYMDQMRKELTRLWPGDY